MRRALVVAWVALGVTSACHAGKAVESPQPPAEERPARLTEIDALEHDLAIAEQRLSAQVDRKLAARDAAGAGAEAEADADERLDRAQQPTVDKPAGGEEQSSAEEAETSWRRAELATPCDLACRALASMKRSAASICAITGDRDERCERAKTRVLSAEERVRRAGCVCRER